MLNLITWDCNGNKTTFTCNVRDRCRIPEEGSEAACGGGGRLMAYCLSDFMCHVNGRVQRRRRRRRGDWRQSENECASSLPPIQGSSISGGASYFAAVAVGRCNTICLSERGELKRRGRYRILSPGATSKVWAVAEPCLPST